MAEPTAVRVGTDSSGRPIYMTRYQRGWWRRVVKRLGFTPVITQGAWMAKAGGGAADSAGYHDGGGCLDLRVWDRTDAEVERMIQVLRLMGAAAWLRNQTHGGFSDPHVHLVLGTDRGLALGARRQWDDYLAGSDGIGGIDYHWRPSPLVLIPPPSTAKVRAGLRDVIDEAARVGLPVTDQLRKIKTRIRKW